MSFYNRDNSLGGVWDLPHTPAPSPWLATAPSTIVQGIAPIAMIPRAAPVPMSYPISISIASTVASHVAAVHADQPQQSLFERLGQWTWIIGAGVGVAVIVAGVVVMKKGKRRSKR